MSFHEGTPRSHTGPLSHAMDTGGVSIDTDLSRGEEIGAWIRGVMVATCDPRKRPNSREGCTMTTHEFALSDLAARLTGTDASLSASQRRRLRRPRASLGDDTPFGPGVRDR